jgi:hypothetical protein
MMMLNSSLRLCSESDWDLKWSSMFDHYQSDLRHAYYIRALKRENEKRLLEIAAGSFRDMAALCRWGISCDGIDYSNESVDRAKCSYPQLKERIYKMDAFSCAFENAAFDLTYHNGFWGYFSDAEIVALAREQARISRYRMIATVHNAHNTSFRRYFDKVKVADPLFNIRFFHVDEITAIMSRVCSKVAVVPVGKGKKQGEDRIIRMGLGHPCVLRMIFSLSRDKYLDGSERLLCIGDL